MVHGAKWGFAYRSEELNSSAVNHRVELALPVSAGRAGWYLFQGRLLRRGGIYDASLHYELGDAGSTQCSLPIPTSVKGVFSEILHLPAGIRRIVFDPGSAAEYELQPLSLTSLDGWQCRLRMLYRVLPQLWLQPRAKRREIGLTWLRTLSDLPGAYEAASWLRAHAPSPAYVEWISRFDTLSPTDFGRMARQLVTCTHTPYFHVALVGTDYVAMQRSHAALEAQVHRGFKCTVVDGVQALHRFNATLAQAPAGHWTLLLKAGDMLAPHALYWMAWVALTQPQSSMIYADEDALGPAGQRCWPQFKPDWSWAHARCTRFMGEAVALRANLLALAGGLSWNDCRYGCYDALLRVLDAARYESPIEPVHIPAVLLHRRSVSDGDDEGEQADAWAMQAVRAHLQRRDVAAQVVAQRPGCWRVRYALPEKAPRVSIIVPTRDALALTRRCIDSLCSQTRYSDFEILIVDNQSSEPEALNWMREQATLGRVRLLGYDGSFNFAAINNMAVRIAQGELVCLLNNDTEVMEPDWLEEMVSQLLQPGVEVVGAKLMYPNGRVQHAGDLVGVGGIANHAFAWLGRDEPGYCDRAVVAQEYSSVTAACLLTRRERYLELGGLDEKHLPVAFNDVDYCLRVRENGGHVVWTPHAVLLHHESVSRGKVQTAAQKRRAKREAAFMRRRWGHLLGQDPFYNPNLSRERADFSLSHAPVVYKPWEA